MSWRAPYIIQAALALVLGISCVTVLPNSPRWLMLHGRSEEANEAVKKLKIPRIEAEKDILEMSRSAVRLESSPWKGLLMIFQSKYRSRTVLALFTLGMVQLSGIDGVLYVRRS